MRLLNKSGSTLIFSDINLILPYDSNNSDGTEVEDFDVSTSISLQKYIQSGQVEVLDGDPNSSVFKAVKNRKEVVDRQVKRASEKDESKEGSDLILGQSTQVHSHKTKVYHVSGSSIQKFRDTGMMDVGYFGPCFHGDSIVLTDKGPWEIQCIEVGDVVLTHTGSWKKVTEVFKTEYEDVLNYVQPYNSNNVRIECTANHPFYVKNEYASEYQWKAAKEISYDDSFFFPYFEFNDMGDTILVSDYTEVTAKDEAEGFKNAVRITSDLAYVFLKFLNHGKLYKDDTVEVKVPVSDVEKFSTLVEIIMGLKPDSVDEMKSIHKLYYKKPVLGRFFRSTCGSGAADTGRIPSFFFSEKHCKKFLKEVYKEKNTNAKGTIIIYGKQPKVAWGIRAMLMRHRVVSSIHYMSTRDMYSISMITKNAQNLVDEGILTQDQIYMGKANRSTMASNKSQGCEFPLYNKGKTEEVEKFVYNIEVEDDHSYTVNMCAVHNCHDAGGYAKMNRRFCFGLDEKSDVNLQLEPVVSKKDVEESLMTRLNSFENRTIGEDAIKIFGCCATNFNWGGYKILYTMMETERVHPQYIEKCNGVREVWLPTQWCIDRFKSSGLTVPAYKIPIGVDFNNFNENREPLDFAGKTSGFVFISVFGWSLRKGYDVMIRAFLEEFDAKDDVTYLVCSRYAGGTEDVRKQVVKNEIRRISNSIKKSSKPKIVLFGDVMPEKLMGNLYNSAHAYVGISRGEGFGLPWCEASMCGLPVIGSNNSGLTDFLNHDNSFLVEPDAIRVCPETEWISYYYQGMEMADYERPAIDATRAHMRYVYENYAKAKEKNKLLQKFIRENYDWDICVGKAYDRLKDIYKNVKHRGER
jgi:glycosyltransferase involved in cell wall biosynthesis